MGKLFIVEGSTGSGKDTLLKELHKSGFEIMRGSPSQYSKENKSLTAESKKVIQKTKFDFREMITMSPKNLESLLGKYISGARHQHEEALAIKETDTIFTNRSFISVAAHLRMLLNLRDPGSEELIEQLLKDVASEIKEFLPNVDGIIHMTTPMLGVKVSTVEGHELEESEEISNLINELEVDEGFILRLNAKEQSIEEEVKQVMEFFK